MIAVILSWIIMILVFQAFGKMFVLLSERVLNFKGNYSFIDLFFLGLCIVGSVICVTSLFVPSDANVLIVLVVVSLIFWVFAHKSRSEMLDIFRQRISKLNKIQYVLISVVFLILLSFVIMPPQLPDSFYYHIQNIMWNEEYHVVPGLANMIEQFGFNSNFFLLSSVFGLRSIFGQFIYSLNALCFGMLIVWFITSYQKNKHGRIITLLGLVICFIYFLVYKIHIASPSTDMLPNILIIYLIINVLNNTESIIEKNILFWIIPFYCITLKLSSLFLCFFALYLIIWLIRNKSFKVLIYFFTVALMIIIPWLIRNIFVSGYLIYPFPAIDFFDVDWKMPLEYVVSSKKYIQAYAISVDAMHYSSDYVLNLPFTEKLKRWLSEQPLYESGVVFMALLSPLLMLFAYKKNVSQKKIPASIWWAWVVAFVGFCFGIVMAPAVRFGFGFIVMAIGIPIYYILKRIKFIDWLFTSRMLIIFSFTLLLIVGALTARYVIGVNDPDKPILDILYKPLGLDSTRPGRELKITPVKVNNFYINRSDGLPMDGALPCSRNYIENIEMRGTDLQNGFRVKE